MSLSYKHAKQDSKAKQRQDLVRPQSNLLLNGHKPTTSNGTTYYSPKLKREMERLVQLKKKGHGKVFTKNTNTLVLKLKK